MTSSASCPPEVAPSEVRTRYSSGTSASTGSIRVELRVEELSRARLEPPAAALGSLSSAWLCAAATGSVRSGPPDRFPKWATNATDESFVHLYCLRPDESSAATQGRRYLRQEPGQGGSGQRSRRPRQAERASGRAEGTARDPGGNPVGARMLCRPSPMQERRRRMKELSSNDSAVKSGRPSSG